MKLTSLQGSSVFAHALPQPEGRHIQELARSYAQVVVEEEWPLMEQGRSSPKAWDTLDELRGYHLRTQPPHGCPRKCATTKSWSSCTPWETPGERDCWPLMRGWPRSCGWC